MSAGACQTNGWSLLGCPAAGLCDDTKEKMESFVGELAAVLILVFLADDGAVYQHNRWPCSMARAGPAVWPHPVHTGSW